jgi:PAS domain S-box-containing protein
MEPDEIRERCSEVVSLLDNMNVGVAVKNERGLIMAFNQRLLGWLGYDPGEVAGRPIIAFVPEEVRQINLVALHQAEQGDIRARLTMLERKDGTTFPVLILPSRMLDHEGHYAGMLTLILEMGAVETAKHLCGAPHLQASLDRIATELRSICAMAGIGDHTIPVNHPTLGELSTRELEVLTHLMRGKRVPAIASHLHISPHTVRNHLKSVFRKQGVQSQSELIEHVRSLPPPGE